MVRINDLSGELHNYPRTLMRGDISTPNPGPNPTSTLVEDLVFANHAYVYDETLGAELLYRDPDTQVDPASIVKLMTALIVMQQKGGVITSETVTYDATVDEAPPYTPSHQDGDVLTLEEALHNLIMVSANDTGNMLARHIGEYMLGGSPTASEARDAFIAEMNAQATSLGLTNSVFYDASGGSANQMTARDVRTTMAAAFSYSELNAIATKTSHTLEVTGVNARTYNIDHTFPVSPRSVFAAAKTGAKNSVYSVVSNYIAPNGNTVSVVVLDSYNALDTETRYRDLNELVMQALDLNDYLGDPISDGLTDPGVRQRWRIRIRDGGNYGGYHAATTIRLLDAPNGLPFDLSGATVTASHERVLQGIAKAIDGITNTWWGIQKQLADDKWVEVDFGAGNEKRVGAVHFAAREDFPEQTIRCFDVEYWDGADWVKAWSERSDRTFFDTTELRESGAPYAASPSLGAIASHRYWRVRSIRGGNPTYWSVAEVEFRNSIGGADETGGGSAIFSIDRTGFEGANAFDGNLSTAWSPPADPSDPIYIGYDFGAGNDAAPVQVAMTARDEFTNQMIRDFVVESSDDGSTWTPEWGGYDIGAVEYIASEQRVFDAPL